MGLERTKNAIARIAQQLGRGRLSRVQKQAYLHGVYQQLVPSRKGRQANGEFRNLPADSPSEIFPLFQFLIDSLGKFGLPHLAERAKAHIGLTLALHSTRLLQLPLPKSSQFFSKSSNSEKSPKIPVIKSETKEEKRFLGLLERFFTTSKESLPFLRIFLTESHQGKEWNKKLFIHIFQHFDQKVHRLEFLNDIPPLILPQIGEKEPFFRGMPIEGRVRELADAIRKRNSLAFLHLDSEGQVHRGYLADLIKDARIAYFGEIHPCLGPKQLMVELFTELRALGFTHLAFEGFVRTPEEIALVERYFSSQAAVDERKIEINWRFGCRWGQEAVDFYMEMIRTAVSCRLRILPMEDPQLLKQVSEEASRGNFHAIGDLRKRANTPWADAIEPVLREPGNKVAVFGGQSHFHHDSSQNPLNLILAQRNPIYRGPVIHLGEVSYGLLSSQSNYGSTIQWSNDPFGKADFVIWCEQPRLHAKMGAVALSTAPILAKESRQLVGA